MDDKYYKYLFTLIKQKAGKGWKHELYICGDETYTIIYSNDGYPSMILPFVRRPQWPKILCTYILEHY